MFLLLKNIFKKTEEADLCLKMKFCFILNLWMHLNFYNFLKIELLKGGIF